jgi:hypothetical protein
MIVRKRVAWSAIYECVMWVILPVIIGVIMLLKYKYITRNLFDVFWGDGWDNCARVKWGKDKKDFIIVRAYKRPPKDLIEVMKGDVDETI